MGSLRPGYALMGAALKVEHLPPTQSPPSQKSLTNPSFYLYTVTNQRLGLLWFVIQHWVALAGLPKYDLVALEQWQSQLVSLATSLVPARPSHYPYRKHPFVLSIPAHTIPYHTKPYYCIIAMSHHYFTIPYLTIPKVPHHTFLWHTEP